MVFIFDFRSCINLSLNFENLSIFEKSVNKKDLGFGFIDTNLRFFGKNPLELLWIKLYFFNCMKLL